MGLRSVLFPEPPRTLPGSRAIRIALRTGHIMAFSLVVGGHAAGAPRHALVGPLWAAIATGLGLIATDCYRSFRWFYQGMGLCTLAKCAVLLLIPWWWEWRLPLLLLAIAIASVGAHMPGRYRYYSIAHGRPLC